MNINLLRHTWKSFGRSPLLGRNLAQGIFMGLLGLYVIVSILGLSLYSGHLLTEYYPNQSIVRTGCSFVFYYFLCSIVIRFLFQKFPGLHIKSYLLLPIRKVQLVGHLLHRSILNVFNLIPIVLFLPFLLGWVKPEVSNLKFNTILLFCFGMVLMNHFIAYLINKSSHLKSKWSYAILALLIILLFLDNRGIFPLLHMLSVVVDMVFAYPIIAIIPWAISLLTYFYLRKELKLNLNSSQSSDSLSMESANVELQFLDRFGTVGSIMKLEIRLILRSKRAKKFLWGSLILLLYPLLFLSTSSLPKGPIYLFCAIFVSGAFSLNYGLLLISWNSQHFDFINTRIDNIEDYFKAKFYLLTTSTIVFSILGFPYIFWKPSFYLHVFIMAIFMVSIVPGIYLLLAIYNSKKIDPNIGGLYNMSGLGMMHWLSMIPTMLLPIIIYYGVAHYTGHFTGLATLAVLGIIGLIFYRPYIKWISKVYKQRKYILSEAFKEQL